MESTDAPDRRKLILYSVSKPDTDDDAWAVFNMARRAHDAGLTVEIQLAGAATGLMRRQVRERIAGRPKEMFEAVLAAKIPIWLSPGCSEYRGVQASDMEETGAQYRDYTFMLVEVAEGAQMITVPV